MKWTSRSMLKQKVLQSFAISEIHITKSLHIKENKEVLSMAQQQFQCDQLEKTSYTQVDLVVNIKTQREKNRTIIINTQHDTKQK